MLGLITAVGIVTFVAFDQPAGTKLWHFYTGTSIQSSVAVGAHGQIYFGTDSGKLYCFYGNGRGMWEYPTRDRIVGSPPLRRMARSISVLMTRISTRWPRKASSGGDFRRMVR